MREAFDPYRKWLGIPPQDQPPNHYRLLGIELFERDPDVIANAADGRMAQIKNFQAGRHSERSQEILNEVAAAKVCLLNAQKRSAYDTQLREELAQKGKGIPPTVRKADIARRPSVDAATVAPQIDASTVFASLADRTHRGRRWPMVPVVATAVGVLLLSGLLFILWSGPDEPTVAKPSETPSAPPEHSPPAEPSETTNEAEPPVEPPVPREEDPVEPAPQPPVDPDPPDSRQPAGPDEGRTLADLIDPPDHTLPAEGNPGDSSHGDSDTPRSDPRLPAAAKRLPIPDAATRQDAEKQVREIYKKEFAEARTAEQKMTLAEKLSTLGLESKDDATARFVLMQLACQTYAEVGGLDKAIDVAEQMREHFDVDLTSVKTYILQTVLDSQRPDAAGSSAQQQVVKAAMQLADDAVLNDEFDAAVRCVKLATSAARKTKDTALVREVAVRGRVIDRLKARFGAVVRALDVLEEEPGDAEANLTAGRWYCFTSGKWERGLSMLAKGSDATLAELAGREMARPADVSERMQLADDWWKLAEKQSGPEMPRIQQRAQYWYEQALPGLTGLDRVHAEKRLEAISSAQKPEFVIRGGVIEKGNVALITNGTIVIGKNINRPGDLIDGKTTHDKLSVSRTGEPWPCEWIIAFRKAYRLQEIRFKLLEDSGRFHRYTLAVSPDGEKYTDLVDRSEGRWTGWQRIAFSPRPVRAVKLRGLYGSVSEWFFVVEFEAYCIPPAKLPE